jgi:OOP family OmpA-OmpF porin
VKIIPYLVSRNPNTILFIMKRILITITVCLVLIPLNAQRDFNSISLDVSGGISTPLFPLTDIEQSDYLLSGHFDIGLKYMLSEYFGVRVNFAYDEFRNRDEEYHFNKYHRLALEGVYNISRKLRLNNNEYFNTLLFLGVGVTYAYPGALKRYRDTGVFAFGIEPENSLDYERIGNVIIGLRPQFRISPTFAVKLDIAYVHNLQQQYYFNGELIDINRTKIKAGFLSLGIGIKFYLGLEYEHADWLMKETGYKTIFHKSR